MWAPVQLPYFRNSEDLPGPLPTKEDIRSSTTFLGDRVAQKMVRVGQHFIVKYGHGASENEGQNLLFVEHHLCTIVHAPRLYAMYRDSDGMLFLIIFTREGYRVAQRIFPPAKGVETETCGTLAKQRVLI
ncbi:hypothetical protein AJ78_07770 [Emergomyces pasteurianus Ep9510]|uniref:Aminoglycoside phosphotransferase domain-containing protein n=1 Tax=Emergomyces pasteurianus Ep9510 TaxID=1447872 RepID=A0A1J9P4Z8_9EURO|nr:hypothetical protein AJ78_07770 [Emergomyces pasteurianus Ep9510]